MPNVKFINSGLSFSSSSFSTGRYTKGIECQSLYNNNKERQSIKLIVKKTAQGKTYCGIKFKIHDTMLLHSKEEQISMTSTELQKVEPAHDKEQDAITINWRSNWQAQEHEILKQTRPYLEIQQCMNQGRR